MNREAIRMDKCQNKLKLGNKGRSSQEHIIYHKANENKTNKFKKSSQSLHVYLYFLTICKIWLVVLMEMLFLLLRKNLYL